MSKTMWRLVALLFASAIVFTLALHRMILWFEARDPVGIIGGALKQLKDSIG